MRSTLLFLFTLFVFKSFAQGEGNRVLFSQVMVIVSDLDNNFDYLKGDLKSKNGSTSFYETNRTLNGTKDNIIAIDSTSSQYVAMINDSTSDAESKRILDLWKQKLNEALTGMFSSAADFHSQKDSNIDGYLLTSDKTAIYLLRHKSEEGWYWINLVIKPK